MERRIVRRYATALFGAARKAGLIDRIESDLGLVSYVMETSPRLVDALHSPLVPGASKRDILRDIFADKVHQLTLSYLYLLVNKRREGAILPTEEEFLLLANEARGVVAAEVTTAVRLERDEEARLKARLATMTGKDIHLVKNVDPEIIGGVLVRIGDTVIDGSIRGQLAALREQLLR